MNTVILRGNVGHDPELRHVASGKEVVNLRLAVDKSRTAGDRTIKETSWFDVTVWGQGAKHQHKYLTKGSDIIVEGELNQRTWTDRDGQSRSSVEIIARKITWLTLKPRQSDEAGQEA
jgi:single-strand DNA-binding protein